MKNAKNILGLLMICGGFITVIGCSIASVVFSFKNPDMTEIRRLLEYPEPAIIGLISLLLMYIGGKIIVKSNKR